MSLAPGDLLEQKYRINRLIGQGGMGAVYEGENVTIARRVAIKVLHGGLAGDEAVIERFEREAQAAGRIGNDHILEVLDMGRLANNDRFMVMEYLEGETLDERCERLGRLSAEQVYPIACQLLTGLAAAHAAGIVHRDLKPDNVFIVDQKAGHTDFVKIIDFGISKFTMGGANFRMTMTGAIMGTPYYMSPEQAKGSRDADFRSDLYAVGVVLFRALTGEVPFHGDTFNELIFKVALADTPRVSQFVPEIDPMLDAIVYRAMARSVADRYQSAFEFRDALDVWAQSRGWSVSNGRLSQSLIALDEFRPAATGQPQGAVDGAVPDTTHIPWSHSGSRGSKSLKWRWVAGLSAAIVGGTLVMTIVRQPTPSAASEPAALTAAGEQMVDIAQPLTSRAPIVAADTADSVAGEHAVPSSAGAAPANGNAAGGAVGAAQDALPVSATAAPSNPQRSPASGPSSSSTQSIVKSRPKVATAAPKRAKPQPKPRPKPRPVDILGY